MCCVFWAIAPGSRSPPTTAPWLPLQYQHNPSAIPAPLRAQKKGMNYV
ncbi:MAG: hypothetical protein JGK26_04440 [Microcoleus sp. PH2017_27_LUM_O_A]|nr:MULTISPECIES: hypothetical protein [unclassified Microcoleus]MCC3558378.1 hypothetical protein [Microcoleus sp. PH2017_27_LUM_O_A]MCC3459118.1 hypothetical protein [Microcoleus sp. PH2017_11_PCY_U_A]MCC3477175.1 hypothetical protein [Microcoleus sp. PH2017_12_PCY_D_A]MCC3527707.1 hypothetical protein [Microcoleus sp. PH2017_21_RUC_O_A]MCC3542080.1 hypothetical protein [Microcoleus sp. PH2017_22_RUC_O_B]